MPFVTQNNNFAFDSNLKTLKMLAGHFQEILISLSLIFTAVMAIFVKHFNICHFSLRVRAMKGKFPEVSAEVTKLN